MRRGRTLKKAAQPIEHMKVPMVSIHVSYTWPRTLSWLITRRKSPIYFCLRAEPTFAMKAHTMRRTKS